MRQDNGFLSFRFVFWVVLLAMIDQCGSSLARADVIISVQPVAVNTGTGGALDVTLENSGSNAITIAGFSFGFSIGNPIAIFTGANESTSNTYIFIGDSFDVINGFSLNTTPPPNGQAVIASDLSNSGTGISIGVGDKVGLGHVLFDVDPAAAPGAFTVTLDPIGTSLSDPSANAIVATFENGSITVGSAGNAPEPSVLALTSLGVLFAGCRYRLRRQNKPPSGHSGRRPLG
jgi:hypothetical protein